MFCLKCGKEIDDNAMRCPYCNCPTENAGTTVDTSTIDPSLQSGENLGLVGIILGAIGAVFAWLIAIIGWICAGTGLALSVVGNNKNKSTKKCKIGIIVSAIGLVFSLASSIIGMLLMM
jgi:uncharacterized membrane protein YvbJ